MATQPSCSAETATASVKAACVKGHGREARPGGRCRSLLLGAGHGTRGSRICPGPGMAGVVAFLGPAHSSTGASCLEGAWSTTRASLAPQDSPPAAPRQPQGRGRSLGHRPPRHPKHPGSHSLAALFCLNNAMPSLEPSRWPTWRLTPPTSGSHRGQLRPRAAVTRSWRLSRDRSLGLPVL